MLKRLCDWICLFFLVMFMTLPAAFPQSVHANPGMKQVIFGGYDHALYNGQTLYNSLSG